MTLVKERASAAPSIHPRVRVLTDRCAGCQECVIRCPVEALSMDSGRWVVVADDTLCVGCRQCVRSCPFSAIEVDGPTLVTKRWRTETIRPTTILGNTTEVHPGFASFDEAVAEADRCLACPDPTCVKGCPAHNDIPGFIAAIRNRDLAGAHEVLRRTSMLPDICSRICDWSNQCEGACTWALAGTEPVAIGALERFVADSQRVPGVERRSTDGEGLSVAIVGSGPAGIAAAWELLAHGAKVTMLEKQSEPMGVLRWGVPSFSLPDSVVNRPIEDLQAAGLELVTNTEVEPADIGELLRAYDAVILANGAPIPLSLRFPGSDLDGVEDATSFLSRTKTALSAGEKLADVGMGTRVLVVGAGNTAMDVARTARRFGAGGAPEEEGGTEAMDVARTVRRFGGHVIAVDWMDRRFARVRPDELAEAEHEGVDIRFLTSVAKLEGVNGHVTKATLVKTRQRKRGETPTILSGTGETIDVDLVVAAMGYRNDSSFADRVAPGTPWRAADHIDGPPDRRWMGSGLFAASGNGIGNLSWTREVALRRAAYPFSAQVWVVGDALIGASTVVESMAQSKRAAQAILAEAKRKASGP